jgi:hypothetical protein
MKILTRPEYLIRRGGKIAMRNMRAVLELQPPLSGGCETISQYRLEVLR